MLSTCPRLGIQVCQRSLLADYIFTFLLKSEMYSGRYSKGKLHIFTRNIIALFDYNCVPCVGLKRHTFPEASKRHKIVELDKLA